MSKKEIFKEIHYRMLLTRFLEESLISEFEKGNTYGPLHLCIGQEAAGVAACAALNTNDVVCTTHRGHAHYIGKKIDLKRLCCEIFGKKEGYGKGRAGHMIIFDRACGVLGGSGIVGGSLPLAVGQALSFYLRKQNNVAIAFFGDGASNTGSFHESLNMAAKWKLPVIFFCETNQYGLTVHVDEHLSVENISSRAAAYNIDGISIFGNDMEEVYGTMTSVVKKVRQGNGPILIEAKTYRIHGFSTGDTGGYQRDDELENWGKKDPIIISEKILISKKFCGKKKLAELRQKAKKEINEAIEYALSADYPETLVIPDDVYQGAVI